MLSPQAVKQRNPAQQQHFEQQAQKILPPEIELEKFREQGHEFVLSDTREGTEGTLTATTGVTTTLTPDQWEALQNLDRLSREWRPTPLWLTPEAMGIYAAVIVAVVGPLIGLWIKKKLKG